MIEWDIRWNVLVGVRDFLNDLFDEIDNIFARIMVKAIVQWIKLIEINVEVVVYDVV